MLLSGLIEYLQYESLWLKGPKNTGKPAEFSLILLPGYIQTQQPKPEETLPVLIKGKPIRCNSLHPGAILTPLWDSMLGEGEQKAQAIKAVGEGIPLGHMGEPIDVAYACVYFASDESKYITGVELNIDGGILAGSAARPGK